jgi:hypothetical protein
VKLQLQFADDIARESFCKRAAILLRMFTSDRDTEVTMAARSLVKVFSGAGSSIFAFADAIEGTKGSKGADSILVADGLSESDAVVIYQQAEARGYQRAEANYRDVDGTVNPHAMAIFCLNKCDQLNDWEKQFIQDMAAKTSLPEAFGRSMLSEKQEAHLKRVYFKYGGRP